MQPGKLQGFVANRAGSPSRPHSANSNRRVVAGQAKVQVPRTKLKNEPVQQHNAATRHPGTQPSIPINRLQNGQRDDFTGAHPERYDTDAGSSIDTTINVPSTVNGENNQQLGGRDFARGNGQGGDEHTEMGQQSSSGESYEEEGSSDGEDDQDGNQDQDQYQHRHRDLHQYFGEAQHALMAGGMFDEGNSYPSTTSGPLDDLFDQRSGRQQLPIDRVEHDGPGELYPQQAAKGNTTRHTQPRFATAGPATVPGSTMFRKGAAVRATEQRVNAALSVPAGVIHQNNAALPFPSQLPSYSEVHPQASLSAKATQAQQSFAPASHIPDRGGHIRSVLPYALPSKPAQVATTAPALVVRPAPPPNQTQQKEEPAAYYKSVEEDPVYGLEDPIGDYDTPELFNMSYDQLRAEDFDTEPRGKNEVLSIDMQQRKLTERLVYVQKNLDTGNQEKFFRALPTREWEVAGDWFLDQFGDIIDRAKKARQNKRKLAREFEDEVEKRYRKVAKRQQNVEAALGEMKEKGQGLIPKSPRASKEPSSKALRLRKR